jgi:putative molybdopterin biosynthesis protein
MARVSRYLDLCEELAQRVANGEREFPSVRKFARERGARPATVGRAFRELARAGVIVTTPRRGTRVAADGAVMARRLLHGARRLRLAGSDDPALDLLLDAVRGSVDRVGAPGSFGGLTALWQGTAEAATLHLRHAGGAYNAPFAARILAGRNPVLVRLWRREQGIVLLSGNPRGISGVEDLAGLSVALRPVGTGTRALLERLARERGVDPARLRGPEVGSHLEVGLAVASGLADCGVAVRSAAVLWGLDFVPLAWEPFEVAVSESSLAGLSPLLDSLAQASGRLEALEGYDLEGAGSVQRLRSMGELEVGR